MDNDIQIWKLKRLIKRLENMRGSGTSMVSLIIPKKGQISLVNKMLVEEYGTATNIKSRVNKLSVLSAITSVQQKLKLYKKTPPNGLVIYSGTIMMENKEKKLSIDFEPFKPINKSMYLCDNKFHVEPLKVLLATDEKYGFVIIDGNGLLIAALTGDNKEILSSFTVELPKKHGRGGQSAARFGRLRLEARHNYLRKVTETMHKFFLKDNKAIVQGLIIAGNADFKNKLYDINLLSPVLKKIIINVLDISYGGENGLNQAIELSKASLSNIKFIKEKKILAQYFEHISTMTNKYCFGIKDTITALEMGAIDTLLVWDDLEIVRYVLNNKEEENIVYQDKNNFKPELMLDKNGLNYDIKNEISLVEWFTENYKKYGAKLIFISDKTPEGNQFCNGFGGIGGILRWQVTFSDFIDNDCDNYEDDFI